MRNVVLQGDVLENLRELPDKSIDCCVTSPPYWGLRNYNVEGQIGLERTPELYVAKLVEVFREVRRVLKDEGTLFLNLGDSYSGSGKGQTENGAADPKNNKTKGMFLDSGFVPNGLKPKDLVGVPWRVAFALQADGWYLRSDIIWAKPNPMPESVTDRPTKSHEYVFLLSKKAKYFYDADAIREPHTSIPIGRSNNPDLWKLSAATEREGRPGIMDSRGVANRPSDYFGNKNGRNKRSVWFVATRPFREAHFATFPEELIRPMVLAGCPEMVCKSCGKAREKIIDSENNTRTRKTSEGQDSEVGTKGRAGEVVVKSINFSDCGCGVGFLAGVVLDPFGGAGTTGLVARKNSRDFILVELNPEYVKIAERRLRPFVSQKKISEVLE